MVFRGAPGHRLQIPDIIRVYDHCHEVIGDFVGADAERDSVILVKNTTEAINKLSYRLGLGPGDTVITTAMEHHSNDLPWRAQSQVEYVQVDAKASWTWIISKAS
ncbi:MAG: aminotransferase class V-fold PLP-dependent enzyme [Syntrophomonadaceae bacterium]